MSVNSKMTALANSIRSKSGITGALGLDSMKSAVDGIETGIAPTGSIRITAEGNYDVTDKALAVVDFSAIRSDLAEAVTAKGMDTLPTSSFDTIATNICLIEGGTFNHTTFTLDEDADSSIDLTPFGVTLSATYVCVVLQDIANAGITETRTLVMQYSAPLLSGRHMVSTGKSNSIIPSGWANVYANGGVGNPTIAVPYGTSRPCAAGTYDLYWI